MICRVIITINHIVDLILRIGWIIISLDWPLGYQVRIINFNKDLG